MLEGDSVSKIYFQNIFKNFLNVLVLKMFEKFSMLDYPGNNALIFFGICFPIV